MKPLLLMSNDDGIESPHLLALETALRQMALEVELLVVAPNRQRSAASHAITLHKPLRVQEYGHLRYSLSGTPVDCVYVGVNKLAPRRPSLVLSGINDGLNLGSDVFYSGTVAAAVEGNLRGIPAVALSLEPSRERDVDAAVSFCAALVEQVLRHPLPGHRVLNVNVPARMGREFAWTRLGQRVYEDDVQERLDPRGRPYYWIGGGLAKVDHGAGTDCDAIARGLASITPLSMERTDEGALQSYLDRSLDGYHNTSQAKEPQP